MALPLYLALTAAEFTACSSLPKHPAWMACHFSPYGTRLTNLPPDAAAMVILNDRIPIRGHDPDAILKQLRLLDFECLLLDFQRPGVPETAAIVQAVTAGLDRPVGVSQHYAADLHCPVFLPPPPPDGLLEEHLAPWTGCEIWLEAALGGMIYTVTEQGTTAAPLLRVPEAGQRDRDLCCHYCIAPAEDRVEFSLYRTREDLEELLEKAEAHGVTKAVGLWQELGK